MRDEFDSGEDEAIERIFRTESGRVLATLIAQMGDFDIAEDALQDALVMALEQWRREGVPRNPAAWLTVVAKRRAIDRVRSAVRREKRQVALDDEIDIATPTEPDQTTGASTPAYTIDDEDDTMIETDFPDERLKLIFTCCHPALALETQVALTLKTLGGLSAGEIARAFLTSEPTMLQRLTRAKRKIADAGIPYRVPPAHLLAERLDAVLRVLYLIFNEGYVASSGDALLRHELCHEAIRLTRLLIDLLPATRPTSSASAETRGLLALLLLQDSRRAARIDDAGDLILLEDQDRGRWDHAAIAEGIALLQDALAYGDAGFYQIQAAIAAVHAEAASAAETDWKQIAALYGALIEVAPSPVIEVNRAVAVGMAEGVREGLRRLLELPQQYPNMLIGYSPYHAARADLLRRSGQVEAAADAYADALRTSQNQRERRYLARRLKEMNGA